MSKENCSAAGSFRKSFQALLSKFTLRDRIWWGSARQAHGLCLPGSSNPLDSDAAGRALVDEQTLRWIVLRGPGLA